MLPDQWEEFLKRYYFQDIQNLLKDWPDRQSLVVSIHNLAKYEPDESVRLLENPDIVLQELEKGLHTFCVDYFEEGEWSPHVRIEKNNNKYRRRDLRVEQIGHLITLDGLVQRATDVFPVMTSSAYRCTRCDHVTFMPQEAGTLIKPFECENEACMRKSSFVLDQMQSKFVDFQKIRLQELNEDLSGGEQCQWIDVNMYDDLTGLRLVPGNKITVTGILRQKTVYAASHETNLFSLYVDANHIQINDAIENVIVQDSEIESLIQLSKQSDIIEQLVYSFAPSICGMEIVKEGILCAAVSNGFKTRSDGTPQRDYSHILICGDPGVAKSNLKSALKAVMPQIRMSSGTGATKAGLTAAAIANKDGFSSQAWSVEAGTLVLADRGGAVIDELDKMPKEQIRDLNDALSNCQFEFDKAGFHLKLWSRCFTVCLCNPKNGRFEDGEAGSQINIMPDTLSRFDLIFIIRDIPNPDQDETIAKHILEANNVNPTNVLDGRLSTKTIQKYISFASRINPVFSNEVLREIPQLFVAARQGGEAGRIAVTRRYVESLWRLAKAEAQLHLSNTVTKPHLDRAVKLLKESADQVSRDSSGMLDSDIISTGKGKSQRDKMKVLRDVVVELSKDGRGVAKISDIVLYCMDNGFSEKDVTQAISNMCHNGEAFEPKKGLLKVL